MRIRPITGEEANEFVRRIHRHNRPTVRWILCAAVENDDNELCGVAIAGRPVARRLDDGRTLEIYRVCTDGTPNACSMLYGAIRRAARAIGYQRIITYTLPSEGGASLRAAGYRLDKTDAGGPGAWWGSRDGRACEDIGDLDDLFGGSKWRWSA